MTEQILIIDDDKDVLEIFKDVLIEAGYNVTIFTGIDDIKKTVEAYKPDLVIIDYLLEGINGGEMCAQIKRNEQTQHIPVILTSGYSRVLLSLGTYGCDEFIEKPFDLNHITERIKHHLQKSKLMHSDNEYIK